jgi:Subtilase family/Secretion system C-terminal sorting domain
MKLPRIHFILLLCGLLFSAAGNSQIKNGERITPLLGNLIKQKKNKDLIVVFISVKEFSGLHRDRDIQVLSEYQNTNTALVKISVAKLTSLLDKKEIVFADIYRTPKEEVTTGSLDIGLNKISLTHNQFPNTNGDSINVSIKEQRFDTTDIDIRGRIFESGVASDVFSSHAITMATILAGAGNTSPFAKGAAWGADLTSSDYSTLLPDADAVYRQYKISVQNHSYGTGIENYYGADAASYDLSVWNNPTLLHIFSSGNSGTAQPTSGLYNGITGFANLTGSFKMAKNIITVGATDSFNTVAALSSKGPAFDGRIKPEMVAYGEDGSSGAAALVSGTAALIQHAYRIQYDHLPAAALVKAVLLNSADDIGEKHVDFISGYGSLNAFAAIQIIKENRYFEGSVAQAQTKTFSVTVPPGIAQLKITVTWMDTAAIPNASKALVNDVDALLELPAMNESWQPWVLSSYPHKDSLLLPAMRRRDSLNTTEQITVDNPQPGNYVVQIKGSKILTSVPQPFAIAYQLDTASSFKWTYPNSTDVVAPGTNVIRWQTNISGTGSIDYSMNGTQWQAIAPSVDLSTQYFKWNVPDSFATVFLRMNLPSLPIVVSDNFVVSKPAAIHVGFDCPDSFLLYWNKFRSNQYQIYHLGQKYLGPLQTLTDSFVVFQKSQHPDLFYSVAPVVNGKPGLRSFTINYTTQGVGCYVKSFYALLQNNNKANLIVELGTLYHVREIAFQKIGSSGVQTLNTLSNPLSLDLSFTDLQLTQGANVYRVQIKLDNGAVIYSNTDVVYYLPVRPVLVYPNPIRQNQPISIIARDPGIYSIRVYDANGRLVYQQVLSNIFQQVQSFRLPAGLYLVKVTVDEAKSFVQKLLVY